MAKNNTLLYLALAAGGYYLYTQMQANSAAATAAASQNNAMPPAGQPLGSGGNIPATPPLPVTSNPLPATTPIPPSSATGAGNVPIINPVSVPVAQPVMPFGTPGGTTVITTTPVYQAPGVLQPAPASPNMKPVPDNLQIMFQNGDYPGAPGYTADGNMGNNPAFMNGPYC